MNILIPERWAKTIRLAFVLTLFLVVQFVFGYIIARQFFEMGFNYAAQLRPVPQRTGEIWVIPESL
jgi:hypothetical protein